MTSDPHDPTRDPADDPAGPASSRRASADEPALRRTGDGAADDDRDYVDKDVASPEPGTTRRGEFDDTDVGDRGSDVEREGEYFDKDVTSDDTHAPVRSFTDKDIPG